MQNFHAVFTLNEKKFKLKLKKKKIQSFRQAFFCTYTLNKFIYERTNRDNLIITSTNKQSGRKHGGNQSQSLNNFKLNFSFRKKSNLIFVILTLMTTHFRGVENCFLSLFSFFFYVKMLNNFIMNLAERGSQTLLENNINVV